VVFDGITDPLILESYACKEALDLALDLNAGKLAIASDCLSVVKDTNSRWFEGTNGMILRDFTQSLMLFQETVLRHERREVNREAHSLAKLATTLEVGRHVWLNDPPDHFCIPVNISI
jgi:ribonuclease HI